MEGKSRNWHEILEFGSRLALGGPAIGAAIGVGGAFILGYVINDPLVEVSLTVLLAFVTFALCESTDVKVQSGSKYVRLRPMSSKAKRVLSRGCRARAEGSGSTLERLVVVVFGVESRRRVEAKVVPSCHEGVEFGFLSFEFRVVSTE